MKPIIWCKYCFEKDKGHEVPDYFTLIWENSYVYVYNCKHCGANFLYYKNRGQYLRTRTRADGKSLHIFIRRELEQEPRRLRAEKERKNRYD